MVVVVGRGGGWGQGAGMGREVGLGTGGAIWVWRQEEIKGPCCSGVRGGGWGTTPSFCEASMERQMSGLGVGVGGGGGEGGWKWEVE